MSEALCTICARGGSKGVKNKNIKELCGKPLIAYSIEQARACGLFEHVVLSTDSDEIASVRCFLKGGQSLQVMRLVKSRL